MPFGAFWSQLKPFLTVQPVNALMIDMDTFALQQHMNPFVTITYPRSRKVSNPLPESRLLIRLRLVMPRATA